MPRNKKGVSTQRGGDAGRGGRGGRAGRGGRGGRGGQAVPRGRGRPAPRPSHIPFIGDYVGFTLADEARQTSQHDHEIFATNLRQRPVAFVSAGPSEPLKQLNKLLDVNSREPIKESITEAPLDDPSPHPVTPNQTQADNYRNDEADDTIQDGFDDEEELIGPEELEDTIRGRDAPEDETPFFFDLKGDQRQEKPNLSSVHIPDRPFSRDSSSSDEVILFKGRDAHRKVQTTSKINMTQLRTEIQVVEQEMVGSPSKRSTCDTTVKVQTEIQVVDEQIVAGPRKLPSRDKKTKRKKPRQGRMMDLTSNDDDAILADYIANMRDNGDADDTIGHTGSNRRELGGTDYYLSDSSNDNDNDMVDQSAIGVNADIEENVAAAVPVRSGEDVGEKEGSESELDDKTLARLIAGQELGVDEDVQFADSSSDSSSSSGKGKDKDQIDTNDDFDLMDWHRPSLSRRKGKGVRAQINFNGSDFELEQTLQAAWNNDRLRKSERKKQREELRALGRLGSKAKANPEDLRVKYAEGMSMEQVADEVEAFLLGSDEVLTLPPMDNNARKMIHELANKLKLKSKSVGKADQRRPTLIRTIRTLPYVESTFNQTITRLNRRYFPRLDLKGKRSQRAPPMRSNDAAATYRDGEIVGGAAPELGTDNRGRAMLEKMGWSSGTALGTLDNKGILQPVTQAMKRSKAGLG